MTATLLGLPTVFWRRTLVRATGLWVGVRLALFLVQSVGSRSALATAQPNELTVRASLVAVLAVTVLSILQSRAMKEQVFVANLGVGREAVLLPAATAVLLEIAARLVLG
jgi:hypothetical protein